jgi:hypothetical protein
MGWVRVEGLFEGRVRTVEWRDGKISGDPMLLSIAQVEAERGRRVTLDGTDYESGYFEDPWAFAALVRAIVEDSGYARIESESVSRPGPG